MAALILGYLERWSAEMGDREALACSCERLTWRDLLGRVHAHADCLAERGALPGEIIPLGLDNGCAMAAAVLGALAAGARPLVMAPGLTPAERTTLLSPWDIRLAFVAAGRSETWPHPDLDPGAPVTLIAVPDAGGVPGPDGRDPPDPGAARVPWSEGTAGPRPESLRPVEPRGRIPSPSKRDRPGAAGPELLVPTSGSTGVPRIVRLSESGSVWNAAAHARSIGLAATDRVLVVTPLHHAATLVAQFIGAVVAGAAVVFGRGPFSARWFWETVARERITVVALTPTHVQMLLARPHAMPREGSGLPLRRVTIGSAPVSPDALVAFASLLGSACDAVVHVTYGLTEAGPRVTTLPAGALAEKGASVGLPLAGIEVRVCDPRDPDRPLAREEEGELQVKTPSRMIGYLGELPCEAEWLRTGDLATIDSDGYVTLHGRLKELIVSGGVNVSPVEVEHALCRDARVREAAVTGEPHPLLGEIVRAFVVPAEPVDEHALLATLAGHLAPYKLPRKVDFLEALPRTPTGKVDKRRLRSLAEST